MKIGVVGCGALGSFYGSKLGVDGHEVHFLLRSDYNFVKRRGLHIESPDGDFDFHPHAAARATEIGICDLVIIGLKTTANHRFAQDLPPLVDCNTAVLTLQNGLGNEAALAKIFPSEQIMGGLCFVCLNRTKPGHIQHLAHGRIVMGEYRRPPEPRTHEIGNSFKHAGIACTVSDNLERSHWEKLIWNIPFNGLGVAGTTGIEACRSGIVSEIPGETSCLPTDVLLNDPDWLQLLRDLMHEVIATANALGLKVRPELAEKNIAATRVMGAYRASTLVDFERGQVLELASLFQEPLRQARQAGAHTPNLAALCSVLEHLQKEQQTHGRL